VKTFRVWFFDGSAIMVDSETHDSAANEARELATLQNAPVVPKGSLDRERYVKSVSPQKVECLDDKTAVRFRKPREIA
jgi:hypothetical protein